jgi:hypothetical protein
MFHTDREHGLRVLLTRVPRKILRPKRKKVQEAQENCILRNFTNHTPLRILYYDYDKIRHNNLGRTHSTYRIEQT